MNVEESAGVSFFVYVYELEWGGSQPPLYVLFASGCAVVIQSKNRLGELVILLHSFARSPRWRELGFTSYKAGEIHFLYWHRTEPKGTAIVPSQLTASGQSAITFKAFSALGFVCPQCFAAR